jgi:flagellar assembly protein FliH
MSAPHKFLFDRSFDQPDAPRDKSRKPPPPPPPEPTFSRGELEAARAAGAAAGRATGLAEAAQSIDTRVAAALSSLALGLKVILASRQRYAEDAQRGAVEALRAALTKAVPALCRKAPLTEIEAMIADCLREAYDEPRVVLRIPDGLFEAMRQRLDSVVTASGFPGKIVLLADDSLGPEDARVEWAEGGAERDTRRLMHDIDGALARALDSIPDLGTSPP